MLLGAGWHPLQRIGPDLYRIVSGEAHALFADAGLYYGVTVDIEPAEPGGLPITLDAKIEGVVAYSAQIATRTLVRYSLPPRQPQMRHLSLAVSGGLARVFIFAALHYTRDVVQQWRGFRLGRGWYNNTTIDGEFCRDVNRQAEIIVSKPESTLELDIAPGSGVDYAAFDLDVLTDKDDCLIRLHVEQRKRISIALPRWPSYPQPLFLRCESGGRPSPPSALIKDFRLYAVADVGEQSEIMRKLASFGPS